VAPGSWDSPVPRPGGRHFLLVTRSHDDSEVAALTPSGVDIAGERMLGAIELCSEVSAGFPACAHAALRAVFALGTQEPSLIRQLFGTSDALAVLERQEHWRKVFAAYLRTTARKQTVQAAELPVFVEPFLICGIGFQALALVRADEADRLEQLVPDLLNVMLTYYYPTLAEARAAAQFASLPREDGRGAH
jgi:hypothetical protein